MDEGIHYCKGCSSSKNSIFSNLGAEDLEYIDQNKSINLYKKGDILYREGNRILGCYCVNSGILKIYKTGLDGKEQIISFAQKGDITGYRSVLSNEPACTTAEVLEDASICFIPSNIMFSFVKKNSDFALSLMQVTCKELNQANSYIKDIAQKTVRERLAEVLLMLEDNFGKDAEGFLTISLTRAELSNIVGTATESVIRLLSDLKNENIILMSSKKIKILNKNELKKISNPF
ncbi:MAG: Crp/Fnr family transcriptional regulator [Bacteroidales bacterium]|nr:MAG: Crp/Fnr family transcriptional regulator [Bacteroidales bacterium]